MCSSWFGARVFIAVTYSTRWYADTAMWSGIALTLLVVAICAEDRPASQAQFVGTLLAQRLVRQWIHILRKFLGASGRISRIFCVKGETRILKSILSCSPASGGKPLAPGSHSSAVRAFP